MLWRAKGAIGFLTHSSARQRLFTEEADQLLVEVKRLQPQPDGVLGHQYATALFGTWVPELVASLHKS